MERGVKEERKGTKEQKEGNEKRTIKNHKNQKKKYFPKEIKVFLYFLFYFYIENNIMNNNKTIK
jgi:hypothetical protein